MGWELWLSYIPCNPPRTPGRLFDRSQLISPWGTLWPPPDCFNALYDDSLYFPWLSMSTSGLLKHFTTILRTIKGSEKLVKLTVTVLNLFYCMALSNGSMVSSHLMDMTFFQIFPDFSAYELDRRLMFSMMMVRSVDYRLVLQYLGEIATP